MCNSLYKRNIPGYHPGLKVKTASKVKVNWGGGEICRISHENCARYSNQAFFYRFLLPKWYTMDLITSSNSCFNSLLRQGNVFTSVCQEFWRGGLCPSIHRRSHDQGVFVGGGDLCPGGSLLGRDPLRKVTSGSHASYWNAFLFLLLFSVPPFYIPLRNHVILALMLFVYVYLQVPHRSCPTRTGVWQKTRGTLLDWRVTWTRILPRSYSGWSGTRTSRTTRSSMGE